VAGVTGSGFNGLHSQDTDGYQGDGADGSFHSGCVMIIIYRAVKHLSMAFVDENYKREVVIQRFACRFANKKGPVIFRSPGLN